MRETRYLSKGCKWRFELKKRSSSWTSQCLLFKGAFIADGPAALNWSRLCV